MRTRISQTVRSPFWIVETKGAIAQLGERLHGMQEVSGSIPLGSTSRPIDLKYPVKINVFNGMASLQFARLYNKLHNMDDKMPFASHIVLRGSRYYYVRRIPKDVASHYKNVRVQLSLKTHDRAVAFATAARLEAEMEREFARHRGGNPPAK